MKIIQISDEDFKFLQDLQCVDVSSTNDELKGVCNKEEKIDL